MANKLSINQLKTADNYIGLPVLKTIEWSHDGEDYEADVYVRKMSYKTAIDDVLNEKTEDRLASRIAACVCDDKGEAVFTVKDITGESDKERGAMAPALFMALTNVIGEVNGSTVKTKAQRQKKVSGMS